MKFPLRPALAGFAIALACSTPALAGKNDITITTPFGDAPALSFTWGASNTVPASGGDLGAGKVNVQDLAVTRQTDSQSARFVDAVAKGTSLTSITITKGTTKVTLTDVLVSSYAIASADGDKSAETLTLRARKWVYSVDGGAPFCFDVALNASC